MSDFLLSYPDQIFNVFARLKKRQWANKERSLMTDEIIIIVISAVLAYFILAVLPDPKNRVPIGTVTLKNLKDLFPSFGSFLEFFRNIGNFFAKISASLRRIFGPAWDALIYIPKKIYGLLQYMIMCIITLISQLIKFFINFFSIILKPFASLKVLFNGLIDFLYKIPGIKQLIGLIKYIINDIIILLSSLLDLFCQFGKIFKSFDLGKFIASLGNIKIFNLIGQLFHFILDFFGWLFKSTFGRFLSDSIILIFSAMWDGIVKFFKYIFVALLNIPKLFAYISEKLGKIHLNFRGAEAIRDLFKGLSNLIKWILLFPFFLVLRFLSFFSYILRLLTLDRIGKWWNNLCQEPGGCHDMGENIKDLINKINSMEEELRIMRELLNQTSTQNP